LTGDFVGVNLQDGTEYRSGKLFLPGGIHETIESAVKNNEGKAVKFGLEVRSVVAANPIGYSYQAVQLLKPEGSDPMDELRRALPSADEKPKKK
jgi:hypothetical protein